MVESEAVSEEQIIQWQKRKRTNNKLQNATQKSIDSATRNPLKLWGELECCR